MLYDHYSHHGHGKSQVTTARQINLAVLIPLLIVLISAVAIGYSYSGEKINLQFFIDTCLALGATFLRLTAAYILALVCGVLLALWTQANPRIERAALPFFDVLESVPVLVFFPAIIILFIKFGFMNGAAIFIIFLSMVWTILFNVLNGLKSIPRDISSVGKVFNIRGIHYLRKIIFPAILPSIVTGSILAWAQGWNIIIVAEVLHTYVPASIPVTDLFGIGSVIVNASIENSQEVFLMSIMIIMTAIATLNIAVWQPLLRYSAKFKFD